jgi:hypothetical protein
LLPPPAALFSLGLAVQLVVQHLTFGTRFCCTSGHPHFSPAQKIEFLTSGQIYLASQLLVNATMSPANITGLVCTAEANGLVWRIMARGYNRTAFVESVHAISFSTVIGLRRDLTDSSLHKNSLEIHHTSMQWQTAGL